VLVVCDEIVRRVQHGERAGPKRSGPTTITRLVASDLADGPANETLSHRLQRYDEIDRKH
jgi:hypothetical protein